ncbi:MAG: dihydrolipoyl dehydrogenase [Candidatus Omnitrophica bacterium]|nr:dihydrolipoyl dehydrogenase [Candidatus Omnitrophota bacterium]MDD5352236.1 dihydrolipoyl dehydrogenase [Candidatus Omnitrophota bacterium]MDD5549834.1 dihydrolipoyl dehydrogenase [Candidatus Omnitrophota bacterium]
METYDLVIIGGGWAGFNAALEAKKLEKKVCLIECSQIGGTCLNQGCIPTKVLTNFAKKTSGGLSQGLSLFKKEKENTVSTLKNGMEFMLKSQKIDFIRGTAKIISQDKVLIKEEKEEIGAKFILIATGSRPKDLPFLKFDHKRILSSDDILELDSLPGNLLIVGGGVIGCEFACALNKLGSKVTIAEILDRLVFMFDKDISQKLEQVFKKLAITVNTGYDIKDKDLSSYDKILLCVGREVNFNELFESKAGVETDKNGFIRVDDKLKTSVSRIYAAGDCTGGLQLAHVASYEGRMAVNNMFGKPRSVDYSAVPSSVFTNPELAQVGMNQEEARNKVKNTKIIKKFFLSVGMAHIIKETDGFLKLIIDSDNNTILGAGIIGPQATELINTLTVAIKYKLTLDDLKDLIFAHPSISEIFTETIQS